jgi:hypothetical protein
MKCTPRLLFLVLACANSEQVFSHRFATPCEAGALTTETWFLKGGFLVAHQFEKEKARHPDLRHWLII